jgi:hypothetical protein
MTIALASMFVTASLVDHGSRAPAQGQAIRDHRVATPVRPERNRVVDHREPERQVRDHADRDRRIIRPVAPTRYRPIVQPRYVTEPVIAPVYQPTEIAVMGATALNGGELDLSLGNLPDGLTQLRLEPRGEGSTFVDKVIVEYKNGQSQVIELDRSVTPSTGTVSLSIGDSDDIAGLAVIGQSSWGGALAIDAA